MRDLAAPLDSASIPEKARKERLFNQFAQIEPTCVILSLRLLPRLCCAVPLVLYLI